MDKAPPFCEAALLTLTILYIGPPAAVALQDGEVLGPDTWEEAQGLLREEILDHYRKGESVIPVADIRLPGYRDTALPVYESSGRVPRHTAWRAWLKAQVGDCNDDSSVTIHEIMTLVNIAVGNAQGSACPHSVPGGAQIDIALILQVVNNALHGCPLASEQGCLGSGGTVTTGMCCASTGDFPDTCAIGACGCPADGSHTVRVCDCAAGSCFNGSECVGQ